MDSDWWTNFSDLHVQTHIYWGTLLAIQTAVITGLLSRTENIPVRNAVFITVYVGFLQIFATFGLVRLYSFFRAAHEELVFHTVDESSPFAASISEYSPLSNEIICLMSFLLFAFMCFAIWSRT